MATAKEELIRLVQDQPEQSSREEIVHELAFHVMVERGLADSDAGRVISNEEMERRIEEIQHRLFVMQKISQGVRRAETGAISHEEAKARLGKWLAD